jgi:hypothetical protein
MHSSCYFALPAAVVLSLSTAASFAQSGSFSGTYTSKSEDGTVTLTLNQASDGTVTGTFKEDEDTTELRGKVTDGGRRIVGKVVLNGQEIPVEFEIRREGTKLRYVMKVNGEEDEPLLFIQTGRAAPADDPKPTPVPPDDPTPSPSGTGAAGGNFAGTFKGAELTITLAATGGDRYTGSILMGGKKYPVTATRVPQGLEGTFTSDGDKFEFRAKLEGNTLLLNSDGTTHMLLRQGGASPMKAANPLATKAKPAPTNPLTKRPGGNSAPVTAAAPAALGGGTYRHPTGLRIPLAQGWRAMTAGVVALLPPGVSKPDGTEGYLLLITDAPDLVLQKLEGQFQQQLQRVNVGGRGFAYEGSLNGNSVRVRCFVVPGAGGVSAVLFANGTKEKMLKREPALQSMVNGAAGGQAEHDPRLVGTWYGKLVDTGRDVRGVGGRLEVSGATDSQTSYRLEPGGGFAELNRSRSIFIGQGVSIDTGDQVDKKEGRWYGGNGVICLSMGGVYLTGNYRFESGRLLVELGDKTIALQQQ